jgi:plastocyanin
MRSFVRHALGAGALLGGAVVGLAVLGAGPAAADTVQVNISGSAFQPPDAQVQVGGTVVWTNTDQRPHDVTATNGLFRSDPIGPGQTYSFTFVRAGDVQYGSSIDIGVVGVIHVVGVSAAAAPAAVPAALSGAPAAQPTQMAFTGSSDWQLVALGLSLVMLGGAIVRGPGAPIAGPEPWRALAFVEERIHLDDLLPWGRRWRRIRATRQRSLR